jgi:hypothetical protein
MKSSGNYRVNIIKCSQNYDIFEKANRFARSAPTNWDAAHASNQQSAFNFLTQCQLKSSEWRNLRLSWPKRCWAIVKIRSVIILFKNNEKGCQPTAGKKFMNCCLPTAALVKKLANLPVSTTELKVLLKPYSRLFRALFVQKTTAI